MDQKKDEKRIGSGKWAIEPYQSRKNQNLVCPAQNLVSLRSQQISSKWYITNLPFRILPFPPILDNSHYYRVPQLMQGLSRWPKKAILPEHGHHWISFYTMILIVVTDEKSWWYSGQLKAQGGVSLVAGCWIQSWSREILHSPLATRHILYSSLPGIRTKWSPSMSVTVTD